MHARLVAIAGGAVTVFRKYPVVTVNLIRVAVAVISLFFLHVHGYLLTTVVVVMAVLFGAAVHVVVTPNTRLRSAARRAAARRKTGGG